MRVDARHLLPLLLIYLPPYAHAERPFVDEPEPISPSSVRDREPWRELRLELPPFPKDADLVRFELDAPSAFSYHIDSRNLRVTPEGVVRYTLVAKSGTGARNVSVEGLRCKERGVYKIYAYGEGGTFRALSDSVWLSVNDHSGDALHQELHRHFLCGPRTFEPRPKKDIIRALRGQIAERENTGFMAD